MIPLKVIGCGACCEHLGTPPAMFPAFANPNWDGEWMREHPDYPIWCAMPQELRDELASHYAKQLDLEGQPCIWLKDGLCINYAHRPEACRDVVVPGDDCCEHFRGTTKLPYCGEVHGN